MTPGVVLLKGSCCSHLFHPVTVVARFQKFENWTTLWGVTGYTHECEIHMSSVCDLRFSGRFLPLLMIGMQSFFMPHHHRVIGQSLFFRLDVIDKPLWLIGSPWLNSLLWKKSFKERNYKKKRKRNRLKYQWLVTPIICFALCYVFEKKVCFVCILLRPTETNFGFKNETEYWIVSRSIHSNILIDLRIFTLFLLISAFHGPMAG